MAELGVFEFGVFRLDADKSVLWRGGELVPLTPKALDLLRALVERGGDVVSKSELMARVWPDTVVEEGNLSVLVAALRRGLDPRPGGGSFIQTVPRRGYRFDAPLRTGGGARGLGFAVLPFTCLGPDIDPDAGVAFADALIGRLTGHESLLVRPTLAVAHYARAPKPPREAARELGVDAVLTGTVQRQGARVRVSVQFVPRPAALKPWAETFEADGADLFAVQDMVAEGVGRRSGPGSPAPLPRVAGARREPTRTKPTCEDVSSGRASRPTGSARRSRTSARRPRSIRTMPRPTAAWRTRTSCWGWPDSRRRRRPGTFRWSARSARSTTTPATPRPTPPAPMRACSVTGTGAQRAPIRPGRGRGSRIGLGPPLAGPVPVLGGDLEAARADIRQGREIDALSIVANAFQCFVHETDGGVRRRSWSWRARGRASPDCFLGYRCLGVANVRLGRLAPGLQALRKAVELTPAAPACARGWPGRWPRPATTPSPPHLDALDAVVREHVRFARGAGAVLVAAGRLPRRRSTVSRRALPSTTGSRCSWGWTLA